MSSRKAIQAIQGTQEVQGIEDTVQGSSVVEALMSMNSDRNLTLVERTRCAVREAALRMEEQRIQQRRNLGFALSAVIVLLLLLGPAIWNSIDDLFGEEHFADLPGQMEILVLMLAPAMFAALVAVWKEQRDVHNQRRGF